MTKITHYGTIALCVILLINLGLFIISQTSPKETREKADIGAPFYFVDTSTYWCAIADFAVCDECIYVLYESKSVLSCYNLNGAYLHSYAIRTMNNGKMQLYVEGDTVYLESREHYFYSFKGGKYAGFMKPDIESHYDIVESLSAATVAHNAEVQYELRGASIWCFSQNGSVKIIHRPAWFVLFQNDTPFLICMICFFALWFRLAKSKMWFAK